MDDVMLRPILVVDNDEAILSSVALFLSDEGYVIIVARDGREALERAADASPRLIIFDMKMPVMDGWAFAAAYRKQAASRAPIVAMTAAGDVDGKLANIADDYIAKPFDLDHMLALVRRYAGS